MGGDEDEEEIANDADGEVASRLPDWKGADRASISLHSLAGKPHGFCGGCCESFGGEKDDDSDPPPDSVA